MFVTIVIILAIIISIPFWNRELNKHFAKNPVPKATSTDKGILALLLFWLIGRN